MIDSFTGQWYEEPDYSTYPKEELCDYDRMAIWIRSQGYEPLTSMDNLITMIFIHFDSCDNLYEGGDYGEEFTIEGCQRYVLDSGGIAEFDYYV